MTALSLRLVAFGGTEYRQTTALRDAVLRRPLGLSLTPEECARAVEAARELRAAAGRPEDFAVIAPLAVPAGASADQVLEAIGRWRQAGATAFHAGVTGSSFADHLARLQWFGQEVIPRA